MVRNKGRKKVIVVFKKVRVLWKRKQYIVRSVVLRKGEMKNKIIKFSSLEVIKEFRKRCFDGIWGSE